MTEWLHFHFSLLCIGEGNGNPLQCSCLENPRDGGAWWAAVFEVAQSRTRLKQLFMHAGIGEGNGNPLEYSCLENPRDRGACWDAIYGVTQSQTRLKWLSSSICISEVIDISPSNLDSSCASASLAFHMMYSAYKLNKQGDNKQPWCTPFPILNQSIVVFCLQVSQEAGKVVWYSHLFKNFP